MADEERKVAENADAEKKKVKRFAYQDVEAAVSKMMTPSVKKLLEEDYKIDMAAVLPLIHQSSPALDENETVEQYSRRCIESALAMEAQKRLVDGVEKTRGKKDAVVVDVEDAAKKQQAEEPEMGDNEGADIYEQANAAQTRIVLMMLGMPFKVLAALVEEEKAAAKLIGKKAAVVDLKPDEAAHIKTMLEKVEKQLANAYAKDGVTLETEESKKEEPKPEETKKPEPIVKKQEELSEEAPQAPGDKDTVKLKNGKDLTFFDFKAALKQIAEGPETKKIIEELGINIDDVANEMFNKIEASAYEDALGVAEASMQYVIGRKVALDAYSRKTPGFQKLKDDEERKGIQENKDGDPRNALFDNMKDILKFPFQAFKTILTGKSDEELKAEAERLNLKDVHLELTTLTRDALTKKLEKYESTLANEVARIRAAKEKEKSGQTEPAKGDGTESKPAPAPEELAPATQGASEPGKTDGTYTEPAASAGAGSVLPDEPATVENETKNSGAAVPPTIEGEPETTQPGKKAEPVVEETKNAGAAVPPTIEGEPVTTTTPPTTGKKPMSEVGKKATKKVVTDTTEMGYSDVDGRRVAAQVEKDKYPERAAQKGKTDPEHEENRDPRDSTGKYAEGRGV